MIGIWQLVLIFAIVLVLFGAGKIPNLMKDLGTGLRAFKKGFDGDEDIKLTSNSKVNKKKKTKIKNIKNKKNNNTNKKKIDSKNKTKPAVKNKKQPVKNVKNNKKAKKNK